MKKYSGRGSEVQSGSGWWKGGPAETRVTHFLSGDKDRLREGEPGVGGGFASIVVFSVCIHLTDHGRCCTIHYIRSNSSSIWHLLVQAIGLVPVHGCRGRELQLNESTSFVKLA
jgi:hypothetical protein